MTIVVTGATGHLGRLTVESLLKKVPANQVAVLSRSKEKAADFASRGVEVRVADYNNPATLEKAFRSGEKVLLISSSEMENRVGQHTAIVQAAAKAGVALLAYTSVVNADKSTVMLAADHKVTEELIRKCGVPFVFLRNAFYHENQTSFLGRVVPQGTVVSCAGQGRIATAARQDLADAAVAVLTTEGHKNAVYELTGDKAWSFSEYVAEIGAQSGKPMVYKPLSTEEFVQMMVGAGIPQGMAVVLADIDAAVARGELASTTGDLAKLIGRPPMSIADAIKKDLAAIPK